MPIPHFYRSYSTIASDGSGSVSISTAANTEGKKIGTVVATISPKFDRYALNKPETQLLLRYLRTGKFDVAFVIAAKLNGFAYEYDYQDAGEAEAVAKRLERVIPLQGRYGEFWALYLYQIVDDDDDDGKL